MCIANQNTLFNICIYYDVMYNSCKVVADYKYIYVFPALIHFERYTKLSVYRNMFQLVIALLLFRMLLYMLHIQHFSTESLVAYLALEAILPSVLTQMILVVVQVNISVFAVLTTVYRVSPMNTPMLRQIMWITEHLITVTASVFILR